MKAIVYKKYGSPDELKLREIARPIPKLDEVLIKVRAVSINSWDWDLLRGKPFIVRLAGGGLTKPRKPILGCDVAGVVTTIGANVKGLQVGDAVFGDLSAGNWSGFAEYVCAKESALTLKPDRLSFEKAAAMPQAAVMAWQGINYHGKVKAGKKVLINGAGGGVGSFAIQLAKLNNAEITAVDSGTKFESMRSLGAHHLIDYTKNDFTKNGIQYDLILDVVGHHSFSDFKRALKPGGMYRMIGGHTALILQAIFWGPLVSAFTSKKMGILAHETNKDLAVLAKMVQDDKLNVLIDKTFNLEQTPEAFSYFGKNRFKGKIVVKV